MINRSKQSWTVGSTVKVGFLSLVVVAAVATPGDFAPDAYILKNVAGTQFYKFVPHNGLEKLSMVEARELIADAKVRADELTQAAIAKAKGASEAIAQINDLLFA